MLAIGETNEPKIMKPNPSSYQLAIREPTIPIM